ncbi:hypothetical protein SAMN05421734_106125 [Pelagirhabdus alkalitolerans]|uniref:Uncharacterized protein n=1 Tax=Pelagirhabdus alkalitolerans TaxID=1612202 RepID=A0A1G6KKK6_9BACI|nr:hypothetical protein SAMN05421734_106125 [Pelagirhabdus alkalitolerans]
MSDFAILTAIVFFSIATSISLYMFIKGLGKFYLLIAAVNLLLIYFLLILSNPTTEDSLLYLFNF